MTKLATLALLATACTAMSDPPPPTKVFDFSGERIGPGSPELPRVTPASPKAALRAGIHRLQPRLFACIDAVQHPAGTIELELHLSGDGGGAMVVESVDVDAFGSAAISGCLRDVLSAMDAGTSAGVWHVHYPLIVEANR